MTVEQCAGPQGYQQDTQQSGQPRIMTNHECGRGRQTGCGDRRKAFQSMCENSDAEIC